MTRPAMARMQTIIERVRSGHYPNAVTLARELEVSVRTVQRDVEFLRDQLRAPLAYDRRRRGYVLQTDDDALAPVPGPPVTGGQLAALELAGQLLGLVAGSTWEAPVRQLLSSLTADLPGGMAAWTHATSAASFGLIPVRGHAPQVAAALALLHEAAETRRTVIVHYYTASRDAWKQRRIDPYHLRYRDGAWYLIGHCHWRGKVLTFAVDRMRDLQLLFSSFHVEPGFDLEAYLRSARGIEAGEPVTVAIRFQPETARYIRERQWHPTQQLSPQPDGGVVMWVQVGSLGEMARWVLQFGGGAEVLAPAALRAMVAGEAQKMAEVYAAADAANTHARQRL